MREITERESGRQYLDPLSAVKNIWNYRELLLQLVRRNIELRYRGTLLGIIWMVATPLIMLSVYTFVFGIVFQARWGESFTDSKAAFALIIFCGMTVYNIFAESVNSSVSVVSGSPNYVKKVVFPIELLPLSAVVTACFFGLVWLGILFLGIAVSQQGLHLTAVFLPFVLFPLLLFTCGVAWFTASIGVFIRDLRHIVGIVLLIMHFTTPIFYSLEMVPERIRPFLLINPLTPLVQLARQVLIFGGRPDWRILVVLTISSLVVAQLGYFWFMKTKRGFSDVL